MPVILNGHRYEIPGVVTVNWLDEPGLRLNVGGPLADGVPRDPSTWINTLIWHATQGDDRQDLKPGCGPLVGATDAINTASYWRNDPEGVKHGGSHAVLGRNGVLGQTCDFVLTESWNASNQYANLHGIGIEICQDHDTTCAVYQVQMDHAVLTSDFLTSNLNKRPCLCHGVPQPLDRLVIMRQFAGNYQGHPHARMLASGQPGHKPFCGVTGHRDWTNTRGKGCPNVHVYEALVAAGYESYDADALQDIAVWENRQSMIGITGADADGVPGPGTRAKLIAAGKPAAWVIRPNDT